MKRLLNPSECRQVTDNYPEHFTFDAETWFSNLNNFGYLEDENVAFAELKTPGTYWVHFCYHSARGKQAIELTKRMVSRLFEDTNFTALIGLIEQDNRKARWLIRQVGFVSLGLTETPNGTCEMFYFTQRNSNGV